MSEIDYYLSRKSWEPEPLTEQVPEDALTAVHISCLMGLERCDTKLGPITTTCACGFIRYEPKVGYKLSDLPRGPN